ncbi:MAG TPA: hypothetical protein VII33_12585, partial [Nakamurella sp.]
YGDESVAVSIKPSGGVDAPYAPRRVTAVAPGSGGQGAHRKVGVEPAVQARGSCAPDRRGPAAEPVRHVRGLPAGFLREASGPSSGPASLPADQAGANQQQLGPPPPPPLVGGAGHRTRLAGVLEAVASGPTRTRCGRT